MEQIFELTLDEVETIVAFIKCHEREDIPDGVWELCMKLWDELYEG